MFEKFENFMGGSYSKDVNSVEDFLKKYSGKSFKNGLYRIHELEKINKWNDIIGEAFPPARGKVQVFGYDWAGRTFSIDNETNTVLLLEPGTGEAFDIGLDFYDFHNLQIPKNDDFCLLPEQFEEWYKTNDEYVLKNNECVG